MVLHPNRCIRGLTCLTRRKQLRPAGGVAWAATCDYWSQIYLYPASECGSLRGPFFMVGHQALLGNCPSPQGSAHLDTARITAFSWNCNSVRRASPFVAVDAGLRGAGAVVKTCHPGGQSATSAVGIGAGQDILKSSLVKHRKHFGEGLQRAWPAGAGLSDLAPGLNKVARCNRHRQKCPVALFHCRADC